MASARAAKGAVIILVITLIFGAAFASTAGAGAIGFRIGTGGVSIGIGSAPVSSAGLASDQEDSVLCCWYCSRDQVTKCDTVSRQFCDRWGHEVSSCSECDQ